MIKTLDKRLQVLEKIAKDEFQATSVWVDMNDNEVKETFNLGDNKKNHSEYKFPTVQIAATYLENLINDAGPDLGAWVFISDLRAYFWALNIDEDFIRTTSALWPEKIMIHFVISKSQADGNFSFQFCLFYSACRNYFDNHDFHLRYQKQELSERDFRYFNLMYLIYCQIYPNPDESMLHYEEFCRWVVQAGRLNNPIVYGDK